MISGKLKVDCWKVVGTDGAFVADKVLCRREKVKEGFSCPVPWGAG